MLVSLIRGLTMGGRTESRLARGMSVEMAVGRDHVDTLRRALQLVNTWLLSTRGGSTIAARHASPFTTT